MTTTPQDISRIMAIKAAMVITTNSQGWTYIKQMADNVVKKAIQEALDAEDGMGEMKRLKASALQKGFAELFAAVDATKAFEDHSTDEDGLGALELMQ